MANAEYQPIISNMNISELGYEKMANDKKKDRTRGVLGGPDKTFSALERVYYQKQKTAKLEYESSRKVLVRQYKSLLEN